MDSSDESPPSKDPPNIPGGGEVSSKGALLKAPSQNGILLPRKVDPSQFYGKRDLPGLLALAQDYFFITLLVCVALKCGHWLVDLVIIWAIGYIQFGTGEALVHEAAHYNVFKTKWLHTLFEPLIAHVFLHTLPLYRTEHKKHHVDLLKGMDSTMAGYKAYGFCDKNANFFWLFWVQPILSPWKLWAKDRLEFYQLCRTKDFKKIVNLYFVGTWAVVFTIVVHFGCYWSFVKYWAIPLLWPAAAFQYWSEVEEHFNTRSGARSNTVWIHNFFHHNEGYHWVHHRYPQIPFFRLPEAHAALVPPDADVSTGMWDTYNQIRVPLRKEDLWPTHPLLNRGPLRHDPNAHPMPPGQACQSRMKAVRVGGGSSLKGQLLSTQMLRSFADYQYSAAPYVWIDRQLSPFWKWCHATCIPSSMHPNMVTLSGFVPLLLCFATVAALHSDGWTPNATPPWLLVLTAVLMFAYQTLDCMDGLQARALRLSSPVGQLFDHGLDAIVMTWGLFFFVVALDLSEWPLLPALVFLGGYCSFFLANGWADRHTGSVSQDCMYFGLVGVTSSEFCIIALLLVRVACPCLLDQMLFTVEAPVRVSHIIAVAVVCCDAYAAARALLHVLTFDPSQQAKKDDDTTDDTTRLNKWLEMSSFAVFAAAFVLFIVMGAWHRYPLLMMLASGSVFAHLFQNLTLFDMAEHACDYFYTITLPYAAGALTLAALPLGILPSALSEDLVVFATCVVSVGWMSLWVCKLFGELASRLRLALLFVPERWDPELADKATGKMVSFVPNGLRVGFHPKHPTQRALYATRDYALGDTLCRNTCLIIPKKGTPGFEETSVFVRNHGGMLLEFRTEHASVRNDQGERNCPSFGSLMNHSCEPNTHSRDLTLRPSSQVLGGRSDLMEVRYDIVADKDIRAGEELTRDYDLFEWVSPSASEINACGCGAKTCRGKVMGFKHLSVEEQRRLLPRAADHVRKNFEKGPA